MYCESVSLFVCLGERVCVCVCVCSHGDITPLPECSGGMRPWLGGCLGSWTQALSLSFSLLSPHFLLDHTAFIIPITWQLSSNCLWLWIKVRRSRLMLVPLSCQVIASISQGLLYVIPTSVFVSTFSSLNRRSWLCVSSFYLLCVI